MPSRIARASVSSDQLPMPVSGSGVRFVAVAKGIPSGAQFRPEKAIPSATVRPWPTCISE
jgi:hypothetical protein